MNKIVKKITLLFTLILASILSGCSTTKTNEATNQTSFDKWEEVEKIGKGSTVNMFMWGGNESINKYMDNFVAKNLKSKYNINLKRVPMDPTDYVNRLINEKKTDSKGSVDIVWINGENFKISLDANLLYGPFTQILPNLNKYYDTKHPDILKDAGLDIKGMEAPWGSAQLVLSYDTAIVQNPPKSFKELLEWTKKHPGKFTYPNAHDDFVGFSFIKALYYELGTDPNKLQNGMTKEEFDKASEPVIKYLNEIKPYLWNKGESFPATQAQQDLLFKNGEILFTMGFEVGKTAGLVKTGVYPNTVKAYVFDTGSIGNSHYLAIPQNSQNIAGALMVIDYLESPEAQLEKMQPAVWGDMTILSPDKLNEQDKNKLNDIQKTLGDLTLEGLAKRRLTETTSQVTLWIKDLWKNQK